MFACFEGIDGAGKSTQSRMLCQRLKEDGRDVVLVADPGTTQIGTAIRQILLHNDAPISSAAQLLLFSAARAELAEYVKQQLAAGVIVLCDRWLLSTLVYQAELNGAAPEFILNIFRETSNIYPDVCFLLDLEPTAAQTRIGPARDRYERRPLADRERMRAAYLRYAHDHSVPGTLHVIRADLPPQEAHEEVYRFFCAALSAEAR